MLEENPNASLVQDISWLYNALWNACGGGGGGGSASSSSQRKRCTARIPTTALFKKGICHRAIRTDRSGFLARVDIEALATSSAAKKAAQHQNDIGGVPRDPVDRNLRGTLIALFGDDGDDDGPGDADSRPPLAEAPPQRTCKVYYSDGTTEHCGSDTFSSLLLRNRAFRSQLLMVQAGLPDEADAAAERVDGFYSAKHQARPKQSHSDWCDAADQMLESLVDFATLAYNGSISIREVYASFLVDTEQTLFFVVADRIYIEILARRREVELAMEDERRARELSAAYEVSKEFTSLLSYSAKRNLTLEDTFKHFDTSNAGFVDVDAFIDGLSRLGIGATREVGEALVQVIGGVGAPFFHLHHLKAYVDRNVKDNSSDLEVLKQLRRRRKTMMTTMQSLDANRGKSANPKSIVSENSQMSASSSNADVDTDESNLNSRFVGIGAASLKSALTSKFIEMQGKIESRRSRAGTGAATADASTDGALSKSKSTAPQNGEASSGNPASRRSQKGSKRENRRTKAARSMNAAVVKEAGREGLGRKTAKGAEEPLDLMGAAAESTVLHNEQLLAQSDEVLHIDGGVTMTYRIEGSTPSFKSGANRPLTRAGSLLSIIGGSSFQLDHKDSFGDLKKLFSDDSDSSKPNSADHPTRSVPSVIIVIVIPDLFTTSETLSRAFQPLIKGGGDRTVRLVIAGLPGSLHTHWPRGWTVDSDFHARSILALILFLKETQKLGNSADPIVMVGFGTGAYSMNRFLSVFLKHISWFSDRLKAVVQFNGFVVVNDELRNRFKDLRKALMAANAHEVDNIVMSLLFSEKYVLGHDRAASLDSFWSSRRRLSFANSDSEKPQEGSTYVGILEHLRGLVMDKFDVDMPRSFFATSNVPAFIIHGSDNIFVQTGAVVEHFTSASLAAINRRLVSSVSEALEPGSVYVGWVQSGHEMLEERPGFVISLLTSIADRLLPRRLQSRGVELAHISDDENPFGDHSDIEEDGPTDLFESLDDEEFFGLAQKEEEKIEVGEDSADSAFSGERMTRGLSRSNSKSSFRFDGPLGLEDKDKRPSTQGRMTRQNSMSDRKKEVEQQRKAELEALEMKQRQFQERKQESSESALMAMEDEASRKLYQKEFVEAQEAVLKERRVRQQLEYLYSNRRDEVLELVEDKMKKIRQEKLNAFRIEHESYLRKTEAEESLILNVDRYKKSDGDEDVNAEKTVEITRGSSKDLLNISSASIAEKIKGAYLLFKDILMGRQELIQALKRERDVEKAVKDFRAQKQTMEVEFSGLKRALRTFSLRRQESRDGPRAQTASRGNAVSDDGMDLTRKELEETRKAVEVKERTLQEFHRVGAWKEKQLINCSQVVNLCTATVEIRETKLSQYLTDFQILEKGLLSHLKKIRLDKESLEISRDKQIYNKKLVLKRLDKIAAELSRIQKHSAEFVDTDVLFDGVMQRAKTATVRAFLQTEYDKLKVQTDTLDAEINKILSSIIEVDFDITTVSVDYEKVGLVRSCLLRGIADYQLQSYEDEMQKWIDAQQAAVEKDEKRRNMRRHLTQVEMIEFLDGKVHSDLASKTRNKAIDLRTQLDRQFIAVDLVLYPEKYQDLSSVEINEMKLHNDYKCPLKRSDIERITKLPETINLALPFLHTPAEVNTHKIINLYYRGKSDDFFESKDKQSLASVFSSNRGSGAQESVAKNESIESDAKHELLVREYERDSIRLAVGDLEAEERLSEDEHNWIVLDQILSPFLYCLASNNPPQAQRRGSGILTRSVSKTLVPFTESSRNDDGISDSFVSIAKSVFENNTKRKFGESNLASSNSATFNTAVQKDSPYRNYTREKLLSIRATSDLSQLSIEEINCKKLLDQYFINEDECYLSHGRLKIIRGIAKSLCNFIRNQEIISKEHENALLARSNSMAQSKLIHEELKSNRIWGSWEQVHPASAGASSQQKYFLVAGFDASRDHPAAFATRYNRWSQPFDDTDGGLFDDDLGEESNTAKKSLSQEEKAEVAKQLMTGEIQQVQDDEAQKIEESSYHIVSNLEELAGLDHRVVRNKVVYIAQKEPSALFEITNQTLEARQSRSHYFEVQDRADARVLDLTVSVLFQGFFGEKGYRFGRLAVNLFRLPKKSSRAGDGYSSLPLPVGFCPYELQAPNTPENFGRIVIVHRPEVQPIPAGTYQIVIGCAADAKYSIHVASRIAKTALPILDDAISKAKALQISLPKFIRELDDITIGLRLGQTKLSLCNQLIAESEMEANHLEKEITAINDRIAEDDELLILSEEERKRYKKDLSKLETEFAKNAAVFSSRQLEREHIKDGIRQIAIIQKQKVAEKDEMRAKLETARWTLPSCMALLRSVAEASQVAISLNTTLQTKVKDSVSSKENDPSSTFGQQFRVSTPADQLRRLFRSSGVKLLTLEQQQWIMLDQTLNPQLYEWLAEKLEEENAKRRLEGKSALRQQSFGAAVETVRLSKYDIERVLLQPFSSLSRKEAKVRKLLSKYHDNAEAMKRSVMLNLSGFNPNLAESVRIKMLKAMSSEEKEWMSLDKVLNPEVWSYYSNEELLYKKDGSDEVSALDVSKAATTRRPDKNSSSETAKNRKNTERRDASQNGKDSSSSISHEKELWRCPFDRDALLRIWKGAQITTSDEKYALKLLHKYNGSYQSYVQAKEESNRRALSEGKTGLIKWDVNGESMSRDVDERAREVLRELDRAVANKQFWMDSSILHSKNQRFPTTTVKQQLQQELENILKEQIKERERVDKYLASMESSDEDDDDFEVCLREPEVSSDEDSDDGEVTKYNRAARLAQRKAAAKEKKKLLKEQQGQIVSSFRNKQKISGINEEAARSKSQTIANAPVRNGWCLACRSAKCNWRPICDEELLTDRVNKLTLELERVRSDRESDTFVSDVALGAQLGGSNIYTKFDLMEELSNERIELSRRVELNQLDKEYHDIINTKKEYVEVNHLHGYKIVMWTSNARRALARRQDHLIAVNTAHDVIDEILDWMLDGWYFGQRESSSLVAGFVPSIRKNGIIRAGQDQIAFEPMVVDKIKQRISAQKKGEVTSTTMRGKSLDRIAPIFEKVEEDNLRKQLRKLNEDGTHTLDETETTLKFGMFMLTFMYFRAMAYISREKRSWSGADDAVGGSGGGGGAGMTEERKRMVEETLRRSLRKQKMDVAIKMARNGEEKKRFREEVRKRDLMLKALDAYRKYKKEQMSVLLIQRVYRGYVQRKAALRWAIKRAEMDAFTKIMAFAASTIQRLWRGYLGRSIARERKQEMAYYIAMVRLRESENDEAEYWKLHSMARYRRDLKKKVKNSLFDENSRKVLGALSAGQKGFSEK